MGHERRMDKETWDYYCKAPCGKGGTVRSTNKAAIFQLTKHIKIFQIFIFPNVLAYALHRYIDLPALQIYQGWAFSNEGMLTC